MKRSFTIDECRNTHYKSSKKRSPNEIVNTSNNVLHSQLSHLKTHHMLAYQNIDSIQKQSDTFVQAQTLTLPSRLGNVDTGNNVDFRHYAALSNFVSGDNPNVSTYRTASLMKQPVTDKTFRSSSSLFSDGNDDTNKRNAMQLLLSPRALSIASLHQHQQQAWLQVSMNDQHGQLYEHQNVARVPMLKKDRNMGVTGIGDMREQQLLQQIDRMHHELNQPTSQEYVTPGATNRLSLHVNPFIDTYQKLSNPYQNMYNIPDGLRMSQYCALVNNSSLQIDPTALFHHKTNEHISVNISDPSNRNKMYFSLRQPHLEGLRATVPASLPVLLIRPVEDRFTLSAQQYLLRQQIEIFEAGEVDIMTHTRGRNKPITMGQVGIRCVHCAHVPISKRQKGSTYFPSNKLGIYQAAQNMSSTHIQCGLCEYMPEKIKEEFLNVMVSRNGSTNVGNVNGAGRPYWANSTTQLGLVDTEKGIRFIRTLLSQHPHDMIRIVENDYM